MLQTNPMNRLAFCVVAVGLFSSASCALLFPGLSLGISLLVAISAAPEG